MDTPHPDADPDEIGGGGGRDAPGDGDATDVLLMQRTAAGDMRAFEALIEAHQTRVVGTIAKMLGGNDADAEDLAQQVFIRVWKSASRYQPTAKFTTWLMTITRNLVFNEVRRRKRHPVAPLDAPGAHRPGETPDHPRDLPDPSTLPPDSGMLEAELQGAIQRAIDALPETQRMAVVLRRYEEMPYEEIAAVLGLSVAAVKSLLFRARTELRAKLAPYLGG